MLTEVLCTGIFDGLHEHAAHHLRILAHNVLHDHRPDNQILLACRDSNRPHVSRASHSHSHLHSPCEFWARASASASAGASRRQSMRAVTRLLAGSRAGQDADPATSFAAAALRSRASQCRRVLTHARKWLCVPFPQLPAIPVLYEREEVLLRLVHVVRDLEGSRRPAGPAHSPRSCCPCACGSVS